MSIVIANHVSDIPRLPQRPHGAPAGKDKREDGPANPDSLEQPSGLPVDSDGRDVGTDHCALAEPDHAVTRRCSQRG